MDSKGGGRSSSPFSPPRSLFANKCITPVPTAKDYYARQWRTSKDEQSSFLTATALSKSLTAGTQGCDVLTLQKPSPALEQGFL